MSDLQDKRSEFLLKMYETYNKEIERHFGLAWQAVSIFAASLLAIASSVMKIAGVPPYIVLSLYLLLVTWAVEVILDAAFWYNRNLVVISNIERQFMLSSDAQAVQWYFLTHRPVNAPLTFMRVLLLFLVTMALAVLAFYFLAPESGTASDFYHKPVTYIPLAVALVDAMVIRAFAQKKNADYEFFKTNAPGIDRGTLDEKSPEHDLVDGPASFAGIIVSFVEELLLAPLGILLKSEVHQGAVNARRVIVGLSILWLLLWATYHMQHEKIPWRDSGCGGSNHHSRR